MAKSKKRQSRRRKAPVRRDNPYTTYNIAIRQNAQRTALLRTSILDYRTYTPSAVPLHPTITTAKRITPRTKPASITIRQARYPLAPLKPHLKRYLPTRLAVKVPRRALLCIKRSLRKEVLHALGKSGKILTFSLCIS